MFHRWKERFLDKRSRATHREAVYKELADMKVCLALVTADAEGQRAVEGLAGRMKGVKVEGVYLAEGKEGTIEGADALVVRGGDFSFWGKLKNGRLQEVLDREYDLLVDLTAESSVLGRYVLAHSRAAFIAGRKKEGTLADVVVAPTVDTADFVNQLIEILEHIKKG